MAKNVLSVFERIVRLSANITYSTPEIPPEVEHPFDARNIHSNLPKKVRELFDDGHYPQATLAAFIFVDNEVSRLAKMSESGFKLMMTVFDESQPLLKLNALSTTSDKDEQGGFRFLFAGSARAIRNPRAHSHSLSDSPDECLDHLALASLLLRRLELSGFVLSQA